MKIQLDDNNWIDPGQVQQIIKTQDEVCLVFTSGDSLTVNCGKAGNGGITVEENADDFINKVLTADKVRGYADIEAYIEYKRRDHVANTDVNFDELFSLIGR